MSPLGGGAANVDALTEYGEATGRDRSEFRPGGCRALLSRPLIELSERILPTDEPHPKVKIVA